MPVQTTFSETMRQGVPGMVNRMVDFNSVTRSSGAANIPCARAVGGVSTSDIGCTLGGALVDFIGISILDPTNIFPTGATVVDGGYPPYTNVGILTKGEIFVSAVPATTAGDPVYYDTATGVLTNVSAGGIGPIVGARWKHTRLANELNVVQLGIQR